MTKNRWLGEVLQNKGNTYIPIKKLGSGSYASVWMCYAINKKKLMAIKIFRDEEQNSGKKETDIYTRFNQLAIKNTIKMHDKFTYEENVCLVFDLMIGSLYDMSKKGSLTDNTKFKHGFPINFVIKTAHTILETLADLHSRGIVHGDVKPENILLYGKTKVHEELLAKLEPKTSPKRIVDIVIQMHDAYVKANGEESDSDDDSCSHSCSHSHSRKSRSRSDASEMSRAPRKITLSDSDDSDSNDGDSHESDKNDKVKKKIKTPLLEIDKSYITNPILKLSDLGSCVELKSDKRKPIGVQTKYYKSPEIILGLKYNEACDIWALGCTIYELLTGDILFDPDDYDIDKKRCMLNKMCACFGKIPDEMIEMCPLKQVFFTTDNILKSSAVLQNEFYETNVWLDLLDHINHDKDVTQKYLLLDLMLDMLKLDPTKRITAKEALVHPLFALYIN